MITRNHSSTAKGCGALPSSSSFVPSSLFGGPAGTPFLSLFCPLSARFLPPFAFCKRGLGGYPPTAISGKPYILTCRVSPVLLQVSINNLLATRKPYRGAYRSPMHFHFLRYVFHRRPAFPTCSSVKYIAGKMKMHRATVRAAIRFSASQ